MRAEGSRLAHVAHGQIGTDARAPMPERLHHLHDAVFAVIGQYAPDRAAAEEVFLNKNPQSTLKLGQARGVVIMVAARAGIDVGEYAARREDRRARCCRRLGGRHYARASSGDQPPHRLSHRR